MPKRNQQSPTMRSFRIKAEAISKLRSKPLELPEQLHCVLAQSLVLSLQLLDLAEYLLGNLAGLGEIHSQSLVLAP
jgi:hypothetical protein